MMIQIGHSASMDFLTRTPWTLTSSVRLEKGRRTDEERVQRNIVAILTADVARHNRLMGEDEAGTRACFNERRQPLIEPDIASRQGRIIDTAGDGHLAGFASAVDAVRCTVDSQGGVSVHVSTEPSRFDDLFAIARYTSFTCKSQRADVKEVARELGVHFFLKVGVRKAAERIVEHTSVLEP